MFCYKEGNHFVRGNVKTTHFGIQSIKYLVHKIQDLVPDQIKHCKYLVPKISDLFPDQTKHCGSLTKFKNFITSWLSSDCHCWLCKTVKPLLHK